MEPAAKQTRTPAEPYYGGAVIEPDVLAQVPALGHVLAWASARGGTFDGLRLAIDEYGGTGLFAARDFAAGATLAFVPRACALTAAAARASSLGQRIVAAATEWDLLDECTDELLLCQFISAGRNDASCEWHPLLAAMPAHSPEPCCWPEALRSELDGTPVGLAVSTAVSRMALYAARLAARLASKGIISEAAAAPASLLWARGMYHSRGYTGRIASLEAAAAAGLPATDGQADGVLLPVVDLMNHRHGQQITWLVEADGVRFVAGEAVSAGEEVCTNYGARPNEELLFSYGFVLREPAADSVSLVLAQRLAATSAGPAGVSRCTHYVRRAEHGGVPVSLLRALEDCAAPAAGPAEGEEPTAASGEGGEEGTLVLSPDALELLLAVLREKRDALRNSAAADSSAVKKMDRTAGIVPSDVYQRGAVAVYRGGQRHVLKQAIAAVRDLLKGVEAAEVEADG
ncbi:hypothetical protein T492DRAFT_930793 [Pavlovales sp. CCMP2436]|nr:hypothetical protein T492DRAFT_930793 [Pavlovales sp. CCMP2436]